LKSVLDEIAMKTRFLLLLAGLLLAMPQIGFGQVIVNLRLAGSKIPAAKRGIIDMKTARAKSGYARIRGRCGGSDSTSPLDALGDLGLGSAPAPQEFSPIYVERHIVKVTVVDGVAITEMDQIFRNPNRQALEGTYLCPLRVGTVVDRFSIYMNDQEVKAEVLARDRARAVYERIVRRVEDPGLVELIAGKTPHIQARLFPIPGRGIMRVKMRFVEALQSFSKGRFDLLCSLRSLGATTKRPLKSLEFYFEIFSHGPVGRVVSSSHKLDVRRPGSGKVVAVYRDAPAVPRTDLNLRYNADYGNRSVKVHTYTAPGGEKFFLAVLCPGRDSLKRPTLDFAGVEACEVFPQELPATLRRGRRYLVVGKLTNMTSQAAVTLRGREGRTAVPICMEPGETSNDFIPSLWAHQKVGQMEAGIRRKGLNIQRKKDFLHLAKTYGILTRLTSLLAK
jgi:hypothetical protein